MIKKPHDDTDYQRVFVAMVLAVFVLITWQMKVEWPRRQAMAHLAAHIQDKRQQEKIAHVETVNGKEAIDTDENPALSKEQRLAASPRVTIASPTLSGSIALKGARFDDLTLTKYRVDLTPDSPGVSLLSPNGDMEGYFVQAGWVAGDNKTQVPDQHSLWQADKKELKDGDTVNLQWKSDEGVTYHLAVSLDENYMFRIKQKVENHSGHAIDIVPYAYINRTYEIPQKPGFLHEGPLGVMDGTLNEATYKELKEKGNKTFENTSGWFGLTDKYWLTALIPDGSDYKVTFSHYAKGKQDRYQVDYLSEAHNVVDGGNDESSLRFFAGAKELQLLDNYTVGNASKNIPPVPLFDRSLDFGYFYFLAKPMCLVVDGLFRATGNFGVALLIFIVFVKLAMFPLANKSFKSMAQIRALQPETQKIKERYVDDQIGLHKATRELYKREKVNPAAGCLPMIIQVVVFLSLFRGLNVTIEMRHAPFYGWIKDLSVADPSNLFTGFGLIPWDAPSWLHLGLLPMLYCLTMIVQTSQQPKPADPVQAKMMTYMPYMMLLFFDKMASGFVLYWTWSNMLSIAQQRFITRRHGGKQTPLAPSTGS